MQPLLDLTLLTAQLVLSIALGIAGVAKLLDRSGFRRTLERLGVTPTLSGVLVVAVPIAEIIIATALFNSEATVAAGPAACLLLAAFTAVLGRVVARGDQLECRCFGQLSAGTVSRATIARNILLVMLAAVVTYGGFTRPVGWSTALSTLSRVTPSPATLTLIATTFVAFASLTLAALLLRQHARILRRLEALEAKPARNQTPRLVDFRAGDVAPLFALRNSLGQTRALADLIATSPLLGLLFMDSDCGACVGLLPHIRRWQKRQDRIRLAIVFNGGIDNVKEKLRNTPLPDAPLLETGREVSDRYHVMATPTLVIVRQDGTIAMRPAVGGVSIMRLMQSLLETESANVAVAPIQTRAGHGASHSVAASG